MKQFLKGPLRTRDKYCYENADLDTFAEKICIAKRISVSDVLLQPVIWLNQSFLSTSYHSQQIRNVLQSNATVSQRNMLQQLNDTMLFMSSRPKIKHTGRSCSLTSAAGQRMRRRRSPISSWENSSRQVNVMFYLLEVWSHRSAKCMKSASSKMVLQLFTAQQASRSSVIIPWEFKLPLWPLLMFFYVC